MQKGRNSKPLWINKNNERLKDSPGKQPCDWMMPTEYNIKDHQKIDLTNTDQNKK